MPTSATRSTRRSIFTSSCTPRTSRRTRSRSSSATKARRPARVAKTVTTELITNDKVQLVTGFVFSPSAIALAPVITQAKVPMVIANAGTAWITNLSPYIVRLSFSMWHPAFPMGAYAHDKIGCKTAALAYTDFPPGKDSTEAFKTGFEKAGGKIVLSIPMGSPGAGAGLHAVLPAHQGRASPTACTCSFRPARTRPA